MASISYHERKNTLLGLVGGFVRKLATDAPKQAYQEPSPAELRSTRTLHWGQRKLLMAEIEFLTAHGGLSNTVVYAGAYPGDHIVYLSTLFPEHTFILYDPIKLVLPTTPKIILKQGCFTEETAKAYQGKAVLFISDIRSVSESLSRNEFEERVLVDMKLQQRCHDIMQPAKSLLKFRFPFTVKEMAYLEGDIYLPVWGKRGTSEARLVPHGHARKLYRVEDYCDQMHYFNNVTRVASYAHSVDVAASDGLAHCYDSTAEIVILAAYLRQQRKVPEAALPAEIIHLSKHISQKIMLSGSPDTLLKKREKYREALEQQASKMEGKIPGSA